MGEHIDRPSFRDREGAKVDMNPPFAADPQAPKHDPEMGEVLRVVSDYSNSANPHAMKMVVEAETTREPLFCFRARDFFSVQVLVEYANIVERYGPDNPDFLHNIVDSIGEFKEWQKANSSIVRFPD